MLAFNLRAYRLGNVPVQRADSAADLELPAIVVRALRVRESIPAGDVYEMVVTVSVMGLMDRLNDSDPDPLEYYDRLWSAVIAVLGDPQLLAVLNDSRTTVRWHGLSRQGSVTSDRQDRHATRAYELMIHVSRLA